MAALKKHPRTRKLPGSLFIVLLYIVIMIIVNKATHSVGAWTVPSVSFASPRPPPS
jgi:hypothetical protein